MPFEIIRNDLTNMQVDAIVNAANPRPMIGYGVDNGIHKKAEAELLAVRKEIGNIAFGDAAITPAFKLDAKRKIWYMRKLQSIHDTPNENVRQKMLCLADKVANLRSMNFDYKMIGDELWERFYAPKELQAWYYSQLNDGLEELQNYPENEAVYWEMTALYKDLFVKYFVDDDKGLLYMISDDGSAKFKAYCDEIGVDAKFFSI